MTKPREQEFPGAWCTGSLWDLVFVQPKDRVLPGRQVPIGESGAERAEGRGSNEAVELKV